MSRCESPSPRSFKLSREAASTLMDPHAQVTQLPWGGLRRILTLETQSAELRPMSNNLPDRGYATPNADLFTCRWPQHLKGVTGGAGRAGLGWASPRFYTVPASVQEGNQRRTPADKRCALILSVAFFLVGCQNGWTDEAQIPAAEMWHWVGILISTPLLCVLQSGGHGCIKALYLQSVVKRGSFSCMMTPSDPTTKMTSGVGWGILGVGGPCLHPSFLEHSAGGTVGDRKMSVHLWGYPWWRHSLFTWRCVHSPGVYTLFNTPLPPTAPPHMTNLIQNN